MGRTSEPPVTQSNILMKTFQNLHSMAVANRMSNYMVQHIPCHTQAVEKAIELATAALLSVARQEKRDCMIKNELKSQCKISKFD